MFDLDGDGYVCAEDLKQVMKALGNDLTGRQRERVQLVMPSIPGGFSDGWFRGRRVKRGWFFFSRALVKMVTLPWEIGNENMQKQGIIELRFKNITSFWH